MTMVYTALTDCVGTLRSSMQLLESSINILDGGVYDYPRLGIVLSTKRHYELASSSALKIAEESLANEITPEVNSLLNRVNGFLDRLERREKSLLAKCELQEGRLSQTKPLFARRKPSEDAVMKTGNVEETTEAGSNGDDGNPVDLRAVLRANEKGRLQYAVGNLELQKDQKLRQMRKSLALQGIQDLDLE